MVSVCNPPDKRDYCIKHLDNGFRLIIFCMFLFVGSIFSFSRYFVAYSSSSIFKNPGSVKSILSTFKKDYLLCFEVLFEIFHL